MRRIFIIAALFSFVLCSFSQQKQMVPDRQLTIFTNEYGRCAVLPILEGPTVQSAFSNLEPNICRYVSNTVSSIVSNIASTLDDAVLATASNSFYLDTNPSNFITSAGASNDFYPNSNPSNFITAADVPGASSLTLSYLNGAHVHYNGSSSIIVEPGEGFVGTNYFSILANINYAITNTLPSGRDFIYVLIDDSESTYPSTILLRDTFLEPAFVPAKQGYYVGDDRYIGVAYTPTNSTSLAFFIDRNGWYVLGSGGVVFHASTAVSTNWTAPNVETDALLPVFAEMALVHVKDDSDSSAFTLAAVTPKEIADQDIPVTLDGINPRFATVINHSVSEGSVNGWSPVEDSRQLRVFHVTTTSVDSGGALFQIRGWKVRR